MSPEPKQKPGKSEQVFRTPRPFLDKVRTRLGIQTFMFDFAADKHNTVAGHNFWGVAQNSLSFSAAQWAAVTGLHDRQGQVGWGWLNPEFKKIRPWADRCWEMSHSCDGQVALLVPAAVGSNWWRDLVHGKAEVLFLNGRLAFMEDRPTWGYPKDCALCLYSRQVEPIYKVWSWKDN